MLSSLLCSIDSFFAALGMGLLGVSSDARRTLAFTFAVCDLCATAAGLSLHLGWHIHRDVFGAVLGTAILAGVIAATLTNDWRPRFLFVLVPLLLSVDNFVAGIAGSVEPVESLWLAGLASGLLAWLGFRVSDVVRPLTSRRWAFLAGTGLAVLAFLLPS